MAEADEYAVKVECGFCLSSGDTLMDPKTLPCSHVHCEQCLSISQENSGILQCPHTMCREVFDIPLGRLPAYTAEGDNSRCDICTKKGKGIKPAVVYCAPCSKKYCSKHLESHDDVLGEHPKIPITEYIAQANKLQVVSCDEHSELSFVMGCSACLTVFCVQCIARKDNCTDGKPHDLIMLVELVVQLAKETDSLKTQMLDKEEKLSYLFKTVSKVITDYEQKTEEMVYALRKTRDEQMEAIETKYAMLEQELLEMRHRSQTQMVEFMEEEVGLKLSDLSMHRLNIEARFKHSHQVEIINKYKKTREAIKTLINEVLPSLEVQYLTTLQNKDKNREVEMEIVCDEDGNVDWENGLTICKPIPKSIVLLRDLVMPSHCRSVCHYKSNTYVGLDDFTIARVDGNYQTTISVIRFGNHVDGIALYNDRIYTLVHGSPSVIHIHDLASNPIRQWNHTDSGNYGVGNKLAIIADQIVVPDRTNKRFSVYSLIGEPIKQIPCPQMGNGILAMCTGSQDTIVVSDYGAGRVFRFSLTSGAVIWTTPVSQPQGLVLYRKNYICVVSQNTRQIRTLSIKTGEAITNLTENSINGCIYDLDVIGKTLIVPKSGTTSLLFYKINV